MWSDEEFVDRLAQLMGDEALRSAFGTRGGERRARLGLGARR